MTATTTPTADELLEAVEADLLAELEEAAARRLPDGPDAAYALGVLAGLRVALDRVSEARAQLAAAASSRRFC